MATNLSQFNAALQKRATQIKGDIHRFYRAVGLETLKRIVLRTPVDTGRARGNWQVEFNQPAAGEIDFSGAEQAAANFAISNATAKLNSGLQPFSEIHLTNNVEYIAYLEYYRRSGQFPEGMVEITLSEMADWVWSGK